MSRSSRAGALALALVVIGAVLPLPASAAPGPVAPVVPTVAPVLDVVHYADLKRTARVDQGHNRTKITLDLTLSRQRARAVATVLRKELPEADYPFSVRGKGESDPAVPNT